MRSAFSLFLSLALLAGAALAQSAPAAAPAAQRPEDDEEVVRITSQLVQTDVVVTDRNDRIVPDLKLADFELYDNGKRQELRFMEFVSVDSPTPRVEGSLPEGLRADRLRAENDPALNPTARNVRRILAFVVDDLTIPNADLVTVRDAINNFVENEMVEGDLVAIVRTVGGKGLLQQFTSDKALLRRAVAQLTIATNPYAAFDQSPSGRLNQIPTALGGGTSNMEDIGAQDIGSASDDTMRYTRGLLALSTADNVIDGLRGLPGRKSLVLFSSGIAPFEINNTGTIYTSVSTMLQRVTDHAVRAGVVVNTIDPRGLKATPGVKSFKDTPTRSALGGDIAEDSGADATGTGIPSVEPSAASRASFGRGATPDFASMLAGGLEHMGLHILSDATGGVTVVNRNNIREGVEKVVARSRGYYVLAYAPSQPFDNKFHKLEVKVRGDGLKVYRHAGYLAREERRLAPRTKEEEIAAAVRSPLSKRDIDVNSTLGLRFLPGGKADLGVALQIDPSKFQFKEEGGKYLTSYDVVGFIYDEVGRLRGGFSDTVNATLSPEDMQKARAAGLAYYANTQLPAGYYQLRIAVREAATGQVGSLTRYVEVPNLSKGRLAMSSVFLHAVDAAAAPGAQPVPLLASRVLTRRQEVRYSAIIYNAKTEGGKPQVRTQLIISQNGKVLFREPEQEVEMKGADASQLVKVGQVGLSKVQPGRYVLTLVVTDPLADKNNQTLTRSVDFTVTN